MSVKQDYPFQMFDLTDKTAIITGGAGLLGKEFCRALASAGSNVAVTDIDGETSARIAEELSGQGLSARGIQVDITSVESVDAMVEEVMDWCGQIDILVNSAALDPKFDPDHDQDQVNDFESFPLELWNDALAVNLTGAFLCSQAVGREMIKVGKGVMINLCSTYGLGGPDQRIYQKPGEPKKTKPVFYTVSKAGILGLTKYLAAYYAGTEIRVNALTPGGVYNEHDEAFVQAYSSRTILGRMARKDEMNGALLFLASDASSYMTGANLVVDGGWTAW